MILDGSDTIPGHVSVMQSKPPFA